MHTITQRGYGTLFRQDFPPGILANGSPMRKETLAKTMKSDKGNVKSKVTLHSGQQVQSGQTRHVTGELGLFQTLRSLISRQQPRLEQCSAQCCVYFRSLGVLAAMGWLPGWLQEGGAWP